MRFLIFLPIIIFSGCFEEKNEEKNEDISRSKCPTCHCEKNKTDQNKVKSGEVLLNKIWTSKAKENAIKEDFSKLRFVDESGILPYKIINDVMFDPETLMPRVPYFRKYGEGYFPILFAVKFPEVYFSSLPKSLKDIIKNQDIEFLDMFLIVQSFKNFSDYKSTLTTHYWAFPTHFYLDKYEGDYYKRDLLMAAGFLSKPQNIESGNDLNKTLKPFSVHIHDNKISPNNAHVDLSGMFDKGSFWSIVIDEKTNRSCVTWHWLLSDAQKNKINNYINTGENNMLKLYNKLNSDLEFSKSELLKETKDLFNF